MSLFVRCGVAAAEANQPPHDVYFRLDLYQRETVVAEGHCTCPAGGFGTCDHGIAVLSFLSRAEIQCAAGGPAAIADPRTPAKYRGKRLQCKPEDVLRPIEFMGFGGGEGRLGHDDGDDLDDDDYEDDAFDYDPNFNPIPPQFRDEPIDQNKLLDLFAAIRDAHPEKLPPIGALHRLDELNRRHPVKKDDGAAEGGKRE
ncbi:hypothetical protein H9P43_004076 [Blastocladiella emersonii ATCC 22665]|nr:hypothetical protein H9P43_004076 [Blastocladiella emersonii ATCC 22665]